MQLRIIAAGTRMPDWVTAGWKQYAGRMPDSCRLELLEIALVHRGRGISDAKAKEKETEKMMTAVQPGHRVVAMEVTGRSLSTEQLAEQLTRWREDSRNVDLLIGGPDGLSTAATERADEAWSLSPLTFPHGLVRILVAEQLYRAWTILQGHPYHRS